MRRISYLVVIVVLASLLIMGVAFSRGVVSQDDRYAVGGEIISVETVPYTLNSYLLAGLTAIIAVIMASIALKKSPIKISEKI